MVSARTLFITITLATAVASAQTPPPGGGGRPFGDRPGSTNGGPFTPGDGGNPAGPYTPGTSGGTGAGPFTPGADGNPAGPHTPGTLEGPTSGGPFSGGNGSKGGFWGRVKSIGKSVWGGIVSVGNFLWTLGGLAPWAHMPAIGTIPNGGVGTNVGRNENTNPPTMENGPGRIDPSAPRTTTGPNVAGNAATNGAGTRTRETSTFFRP